ncbi:META domain-containing protein [Roseateles sp.]|uniref:META domain-containing protein n=1 Tax=Roseateles sp. TaxID=1971397 RepID=UPI003BA7B3EA
MNGVVNPKRMALAAAGLLLTLNFSGCTAVSAAKPNAPAAPVALEGSAWIQRLGDAAGSKQGATVRFEGGQVLGSDGCNRFSAPYKTQGSSFELGARGPSTLMACPPEVMARADAFMAALSSAKTYRVNDQGQLELLAADGKLLQALAPQSLALVGSVWNATGINNGKEAVVSLVAGSSVSLNFSAEGRVYGSAGCNQFNGTYKREGAAKLTLGPLVSTRMACLNAEVAEQERAFLKALESVATLQIEGSWLELRRADGALAVSLQRGEGS